MPKTKIEWSEFTWKIITGCLRNCSYCYVKRFDREMVPRFHKNRLQEPLGRKKPTVWFVANTGDMFGNWVPKEWIMYTLDVIKRCPQHTFQLLTKNPKIMAQYDSHYYKNVWTGTSVTKNEDIHRIDAIRNIKNAGIRFISFEPLLEALDLSKISFKNINWCIIGAESVFKSHIAKNLKAAQGWAAPLIQRIRKESIPVFTKENLQWMPEYREMPDRDMQLFLL